MCLERAGSKPMNKKPALFDIFQTVIVKFVKTQGRALLAL